jgi:hypothetical protein
MREPKTMQPCRKQLQRCDLRKFSEACRVFGAVSCGEESTTEVIQAEETRVKIWLFQNFAFNFHAP